MVEYTWLSKTKSYAIQYSILINYVCVTLYSDFANIPSVQYSDVFECTATFPSVQRRFRVYSDFSQCTATFSSVQRPFPVYSDVSDNLILLLLKVFRLLKDMTLQTKAQLCRQSFLYK